MKIVADQNIPYVEEAFSRLGSVHLYPGREINNGIVRDADILLVRTVTQVDESLLTNSSVKFVGTATIGYDHVDTGWLKSQGTGFSAAPGCNANSVGEYVAAALLTLANRHRFSLNGKTIGIIGAGNTGTRVAEKARALGMHVLLNDPPLARKTQDPVFRPLKELLSDADVLSYHVPLTSEGMDATWHMGNEKLFNALKPGTFLINCSRGPVLKTADLKKALNDETIGAAVIDVWEGEPDIPCSLLESVDIGTPHIAGYSRDGKANATRMIYREACRQLGISDTWTPRYLPEPAHPIVKLVENSRDGESRDGPETTKSTPDTDSAEEKIPGVCKTDEFGNTRRIEEILEDIIRKVYDIEEDDQRLRKILSLPQKERGPWFETLRNEYPVRREFHSVTIQSAEPDGKLCSMLDALGFVVSRSSVTQTEHI